MHRHTSIWIHGPVHEIFNQLGKKMCDEFSRFDWLKLSSSTFRTSASPDKWTKRKINVRRSSASSGPFTKIDRMDDGPFLSDVAVSMSFAISWDLGTGHGCSSQLSFNACHWLKIIIVDTIVESKHEIDVRLIQSTLQEARVPMMDMCVRSRRNENRAKTLRVCFIFERKSLPFDKRQVLLLTEDCETVGRSSHMYPGETSGSNDLYFILLLAFLILSQKSWIMKFRPGHFA